MKKRKNGGRQKTNCSFLSRSDLAKVYGKLYSFCTVEGLYEIITSDAKCIFLRKLSLNSSRYPISCNCNTAVTDLDCRSSCNKVVTMQVWIDDGKSEADCALPAHRHTIDDDRGAPQPWYWRDTFPYTVLLPGTKSRQCPVS